MKKLIIVFTVILLFLTIGCSKQNILQKGSDPSTPIALTLKSALINIGVTTVLPSNDSGDGNYLIGYAASSMWPLKKQIIYT